MYLKAIVFILISLSLIEAIGITQSVGAKGYLTCKGEPAAGVRVKMYDEDFGLDPDDFMAETMTDADGYFAISGSKSELLTIDPKINFYHNCNDNILEKICDRKFTIYIPDKYVSSGSVATTFYDVRTMEISGKITGEDRDCIN